MLISFKRIGRAHRRRRRIKIIITMMMSEPSNSIDGFDDFEQSRCFPGLECDEKLEFCDDDEDNEEEDLKNLQRVRKEASE